MPKAKRVLFRRSPSLVSYWNAGRMIFENYATGKGVTAAPIATEVLDFFTRWRTADAIFPLIVARGYQGVGAAFATAAFRSKRTPYRTRHDHMDALESPSRFFSFHWTRPSFHR